MMLSKSVGKHSRNILENTVGTYSMSSGLSIGQPIEAHNNNKAPTVRGLAANKFTKHNALHA